MKKDNKILFLAFIILLISFLIFNSNVLNFIGKISITSKATSGEFGVSITIKEGEHNALVDENGNLIFSYENIKGNITKISGLTQGWMANITMFNNTYPSEWTETAPTSSEVATKLKHFEILINNQITGTYTIYFNVSSSDLGSASASNVALFVFENNTNKWTELTTTLVDGTSNPRQFSATLTHFSRFIIGEKPSTGSSGGVAGVTGTSSGGGGTKYSGEFIKELIPEKPKPVHIKGNLFDISLKIPEKYSEVFNGEKLLAEINIINIKKLGVVSVNLEYFIDDINKKILFNTYETKVVENDIIYIKEIEIPLDILPGYYLLNVRLKYEDDTALAGYPFRIVDKKTFKEEIYIIDLLKDYSVFLIILLIAVFLIILKLRIVKRRTQENIRKKYIFKEISKLKRGNNAKKG